MREQSRNLCVMLTLALTLPAAMALCQSTWRQQEFVLGAFWDPPYDAKARIIDNDVARFRLAREANFNLLTGAQSEPAIDRTFEGMVWALKVAKNAGLKYLVTDRRFYPAYEKVFERADAERLAQDYRSLPADLRATLYGYALCDEPHYTNEHLRNVSDWKWFLERADPEKLVYVNLVASYAPSYNWGGFKGGREDGILDDNGKHSYEQYLSSYIDSLRPAVVSFDHYPFFKGGKMRRDYFYNLAIIRERAAGKPFWAYPMTVDHLTYADPDEAQLNFMYFCPVAYGAKGLVAFCFWAPNDEKDYRLSLIDRAGKPTVKYPIVQRLNLYIKRFLGPIVMNAQLPAVFHASRFPAGQQFINDTISVGTKLIRSSENKNLLLGVFKTKTVTYLLIVNKDLQPAKGSRIQLNGVFPSVALGPSVVRFSERTPLTFTSLKTKTSSVERTTSFAIPEMTGGEGIVVRLGVQQGGNR